MFDMKRATLFLTAFLFSMTAFTQKLHTVFFDLGIVGEFNSNYGMIGLHLAQKPPRLHDAPMWANPPSGTFPIMCLEKLLVLGNLRR